MSIGVDMFSSEICSSFMPLTDREFYMKKYDKSFISYLDGNIIKHYPENREKIAKNPFRYLLPQALDNKRVDTFINWEAVSNSLKRSHPFSTERKKKADRNLAYCNGKVFLTKKYFIFGLRNTGADTCHMYQTYKNPLLYFLPKNPVPYPEGYFPYKDQNHYDCFLIEPYSEYKVQENTTYLIIKKNDSTTLFGIHKLRVSTEDRTCFK